MRTPDSLFILDALFFIKSLTVLRLAGSSRFYLVCSRFHSAQICDRLRHTREPADCHKFKVWHCWMECTVVSLCWRQGVKGQPNLTPCSFCLWWADGECCWLSRSGPTACCACSHHVILPAGTGKHRAWTPVTFVLTQKIRWCLKALVWQI